MNGKDVAKRFSVWLAALLSGCASRPPPPCHAPGSCERGFTCVASVCLRAGSELAPLDAQRIVVAAEQIAVVGRSSDGASLPPEIALGRSEGAAPVVLLRFPAPWGKKVRILRAFVTLEPLPGAVPQGAPVLVSVARVLEPWSPSDVSWGRLPRMSPYEGSALTGIETLRIDVTEIVQRWTDGRLPDQGIALTARTETAQGATFASGTVGARGPRLDVYLR